MSVERKKIVHLFVSTNHAVGKERGVYRKVGKLKGKKSVKAGTGLEECIGLAVILNIQSNLWRVKEKGSERVEGRPENSR